MQSSQYSNLTGRPPCSTPGTTSKSCAGRLWVPCRAVAVKASKTRPQCRTGGPPGGAIAAVDPQASTLSAARASQAVGVEQFDELGVAGVLVQIIDQGEVHGQDLQAT